MAISAIYYRFTARDTKTRERSNAGVPNQNANLITVNVFQTAEYAIVNVNA